MTLAVEELYQVIDERTRGLIVQRSNDRPALHRRGWLVRRGLLVADVFGLTVAFAAAEAIYGPSAGDGRFNQLGELIAFVVSLPLWVVAAKMYRLYDRDEERTDHSTTDDFGGVFHLVTVGTFLLFAFARASHWFNPQFWKLFIFWALAAGAVTTARVGVRAYCRRRIEYLQNTIIVGAGDVGQSVACKLLKHPEYGLNLVGFIDGNPKERIPRLEYLTVLGAEEHLPELVELLDVERVIVAFSNERHEDVLDMIRRLNVLDVQVDIVPRFFDVLHAGVGLHTVEGVPVLSLPPGRLSWSSRLVKRMLDIAVASIGLILLVPLFAAVAVAIRLDSRGPIFFRQVRMGERRRIFRIWKFRSMVTHADERKHEFAHLNKHLAPGGDARMFKIDNDPRVTRVGGLLRRTSIDELPQLLNVLLGEMSLVGPRPLILDEDREVRLWGERRLDLRPGITGLWQVLGRSDISFDEMLRLDYLYVTGWSLGADLRLIARTLPLVVGRGRNG